MEIKLPGNVVSIEIFRADRQLKAMKGSVHISGLGLILLTGCIARTAAGNSIRLNGSLSSWKRSGRCTGSGRK